jgi:ferredoxin
VPQSSARPAHPPQPRLHVDWTACDGRGLCMELLPELLEADPWGFPLARRSTPGRGAADPVVPAHLRAAADRAISGCPLGALSLRPAD